MTSRYTLLLFILAAFCATGSLRAEPYQHAASGFQCPDDVAGFSRTGVDDYESKEPGLGVAGKYRRSSGCRAG